MPSEVTHSEEETIDLGRRIARELPRRALVLLIGNLGAGKTTLAKGIVDGLGAAPPEEVSSPTFTLIHEYGPSADGPSVYHIDLYRLDTPAQVATLGLDEIFDREAVVLMEWGERFPDLWPRERTEIRLRAEGDSRVVDWG
jgi:tRNA threonylcarbamoyladenosine biosynthesis protein TsaE